MRSRPACAVTARALSLVISSEYDPDRAARLLSERTTPAALAEAVAHLQPALFDDDDDRVVVAATELLLQALASTTAPDRAA